MSTLNFAEFHFLRLEWFALLLPFAVLCWRLFHGSAPAGAWRTVCDEHLLPYLLVQRGIYRSRLNFGACMFSGVVAIVALAGPTWERLPTPVFRDESALVILLDLSRSMDATDISPSRLERAKFKVIDILRQRRDGQTALVVYAAEPYVVTPLTNDVGTIESQLPALRTGIMPSQGSNAASAIKKGIELLKQSGATNGTLLLVTDGMRALELGHAEPLITANGTRLSILGVGTQDGAPIPDENGGFIKDQRGNIVLEPLRPKPLRRLAARGNGIYQSVATSEKDVQALLAVMDNQFNQSNTSNTKVLADRWLEVGPWLLLGLIPIIPFAFRQGILTLYITASIFVMTCPEYAHAGWWLTPDQEAQLQFDRGDFNSAAKQFENEDWRATAHYRADRFEDVVTEIGESSNAEAQYNKGNALARLGRLEEAIAAYGNTLSQVNDHQDALHNKALLEELLQQQKQEEQQKEQKEQTNQSNENANSDENPKQGSDEQSPQESEAEKSSERTTETSPTESGWEELPNESENSGGEEDSEAQIRAELNSEQENEQATEQWLRKIPDDPGGLLRRKFEHEYQRKHGRNGRRARSW